MKKGKYIISYKCVFTERHKLTSSGLINVTNWFWENFEKKKLSALLTTSGVFTLTALKVVNVKPPEDLKVFLAQLEIRLRSTVIIFPRVCIGCDF
jgi:hypothetical protein